MKEKDEKKGGKPRLDEVILQIVEGMSPRAANMVLDSFNEIPMVVRDAVNKFCEAEGKISEKGGIKGVKAALEELKKACEGDSVYEELYSKAREEANQEIAEMYANGGMSV